MTFKIKPDFPDLLEVEGAMNVGDYNHVWKCLQNFYALVFQAVVSPAATDVCAQLRLLTFRPFGGPRNWNRVSELMFREIERADAGHLGVPLHEALDKDWELSGLDREEYLHANVEIVCSRCGR